MLIEVKRLKDDNESTVGTMHIDGKFQCFVLEDTFNEPKVYGKTRIPEGEYRMELRTEGGMTKRYAEKYDYHQGMLWIRNVPNFKWVYIHVGNDADDTDGCILLGKTASVLMGNQRVSGSVLAYQDAYPKIANAIYSGEEVTVSIS